MTASNPTMRQWTRDCQREPIVRVGVILEEDAQALVRLLTPDQSYLLGVDHQPPQELGPRAELSLALNGDALTLRVGHGPPGTAGCVRLWAATPVPLTPGAGVLVRDVVAGRGFHWQKRIDQTLAGTLELRPARGGVVLINELPLEDYLAGVITAEMSGACPTDLLKAQCVVARSWLLAMTEPKHRDQPFDRCNDDCCQRYQGTGDLSSAALFAVRDTRGLVLQAPTGDVLDANYAKSCGGISETPVAVWGLDKPGISPIVDAPPDAPERRFFPVTEANLDEYLNGEWLKTTQCYCSPNVVPIDQIGRYLGRVDTTDNYFRWTVRYARQELEDLLRAKLPEARELAELRDVHVRARGASGRAYAVTVEWIDTRGAPVTVRLDSEYRIRQVLHPRFLYSSAFAVRAEWDERGTLRSITLRGAGWGHGVGLCQIGALGMALCGLDYETICRHYYPKSRLARVYP